MVGARPTGPELDGVFRLSGGRASFVPVEVGIAGDEYFEVLSGVEAGDTLVAGPYTAIRQLQAGDRIRRLETPPI
jgi:HlyD family secretion protein